MTREFLQSIIVLWRVQILWRSHCSVEYSACVSGFLLGRRASPQTLASWFSRV